MLCSGRVPCLANDLGQVNVRLEVRLYLIPRLRQLLIGVCETDELGFAERWTDKAKAKAASVRRLLHPFWTE